MPFPVGIGIVTYNRKDILSDTIDRVRAFTRQPDAALVVADDGSTDGTLAMLRDKQVPVITGVNMGIAWNKNRALFLLSHMLHCETVILLEDDTQPTASRLGSRMDAGRTTLGPCQLCRRLDDARISSGSWNRRRPGQSNMVTAQCAAYSSDCADLRRLLRSALQGLRARACRALRGA